METHQNLISGGPSYPRPRADHLLTRGIGVRLNGIPTLYYVFGDK